MKKRVFTCALLLSMCMSAFSDTLKNVSVFLPEKEKATGRAVVICPGGGYTHLAVEHEGTDWAPFFNERGIAVAVVAYTMPAGNKDLPIADAENAIRYLRENAVELNINPDDIGIMGSSAGGHLASTVATHATKETRPNFQILFYPVITMDPTYTHIGSHNNLLGENPGEEMEIMYSSEKQVTADTPRAVIFYSDDDNVVPPFNGVNYYKALHEAKVPASLFIYPSGGHGWGSRTNFTYNSQMLSDLDAWLKSF
ncbi:MAG: alpha/beta hydrolase [Bacteroides sp.]|nr:alpha/beta hydrolase [Bacteroides sp.]